MQKKILSETSIITGTVSDKSLLKHQMVKNHVMNNFSLENKIKDDQYWHLKDYITLPYHQHLQWFEDYIRDIYKLEHDRTLVKIPSSKLGNRAIVQQTGEQINFHNHIQQWDLEGSPEISCLWCISETNEENPVHVIFKYDDGRNKDQLWKIPLEYNKFILYSSHLEHSIEMNHTRDFIINVSTHYHLL
tara:strand:+ start:252 stop:818 length:567 start_codon:yes stop_codon:yes gene_type:complete